MSEADKKRRDEESDGEKLSMQNSLVVDSHILTCPFYSAPR